MSALPRAAAGPALRVACAELTDVGLVRSGNEDAYLARPDDGLWAVADGMGGHEDGEWASEAIVGALGEARLSGVSETDANVVAAAIHSANAAILTRAEAYRLRMGSTVVCLLLGPESFRVFWVGDSRAYRLRDGQLQQLTRDHSQVQAKVDLGLMTPAEARAHPMSHILTRAVGTEAGLAIDEASGDAACGDIFLLCSDGLHGVVPDAQIEPALGASPQEACEALVALALARGGPDNVTVAVIAVG